MIKFQKPNLPDCGTVLICDKKVPLFYEFENAVETLPIETLPPSMMYHADLQICHLGKGVFLSAPETYNYYSKELGKFGAKVICGEKSVLGTYGKDCAYNILVIGNYAFHNTDYTPLAAKKYFEENKIKLIHVNQGYTKCASAPVGENAIITPDPSIKKAAEEIGIDCLGIEWNGVTLQGFSYGFFGGAGGRISKNEFYVYGSIKNHPSKDKITEFLAKHNMNLVEGGSEMLCDFGSLIIL